MSAAHDSKNKRRNQNNNEALTSFRNTSALKRRLTPTWEKNTEFWLFLSF